MTNPRDDLGESDEHEDGLPTLSDLHPAPDHLEGSPLERLARLGAQIATSIKTQAQDEHKTAPLPSLARLVEAWGSRSAAVNPTSHAPSSAQGVVSALSPTESRESSFEIPSRLLRGF